MIQTFIGNFVITGAAAIISKTLLAPVERAKLILQTQTSAYQIMTGQRKPYSGLLDLFYRIPMEQVGSIFFQFLKNGCIFFFLFLFFF